jgi:uncharacterized membrane protein (DUF373 family)
MPPLDRYSEPLCRRHRRTDWVVKRRDRDACSQGAVAMSLIPQTRTRQWIGRAFSAVEDVVYIGLGILLTGVAIALLCTTVVSFGQCVLAHTLAADIITLLDHILLILLVVELLYTVQVSFREHAVIPEPFLLVGLIAAIRRVLVLTAELGHVGMNAEPTAQYFMMELGVLYVLQRRDPTDIQR